MIERPELSPEAAVEGMRKGVQDYLIEPVADGEVLTRVEAAARTKELQHELVAQGARLEALLREDALTGLSNRRAILTQLGGHGLRRPPSRAPAVDRGAATSTTSSASTTPTATRPATRCWWPPRTRWAPTCVQEDQLGRLGGEEFLVLLPDTDADAAMAAAERMRDEVAHAPTPVPVTVSIGIATWEDAETPEAFLAPRR